MSGMGNRFVQAGYKEPKFLIEVDGIPVIEHIIGLFPKDAEFIFICNEKHAEETPVLNILDKLASKKQIIVIPCHKKGPVYAVSEVYDFIDDEEEVIVNYCDFSMDWEYLDFHNFVQKSNCDGSIVCYKGFHPHMLGGDNYAFVKCEPNSNKFLEIKEKESYTDDKMSEFASTGTYYFKKGKYVKKYFSKMMEKNIHLNNEYYVSLIYNLMHEDGLSTHVYEVPHMLQWGTPLDLKIYNKWSDYFRRALEGQEKIKIPNAITILPMAGKGSRFLDNGYAKPKPLINVNGRSMVLQAAKCLPDTEKIIFSCLLKHLDDFTLKDQLTDTYPDSEIVPVDKVLPGQACTCEFSIRQTKIENDTPILISACDNGVMWNKEGFSNLVEDPEVDVIVWSCRNNSANYYNPNMYSWLDVDKNDNIKKVYVKEFFGLNPLKSFAIVGTMFFRKTEYFINGLKALYEKNLKTNGEYYVDNVVNEIINMGLTVKNFEVDEYICWGTPNDLKTYEYWQQFFDKCDWHPYDYKKDFFTLCD